MSSIGSLRNTTSPVRAHMAGFRRLRFSFFLHGRARAAMPLRVLDPYRSYILAGHGGRSEDQGL